MTIWTHPGIFCHLIGLLICSVNVYGPVPHIHTHSHSIDESRKYRGESGAPAAIYRADVIRGIHVLEGKKKDTFTCTYIYIHLHFTLYLCSLKL